MAIPVAEEEYKGLIMELLEKYPQIIFIKKKNVTMTDQV